GHIVALCNPTSGSIGRMTKKILTSAGILNEVMANTAFLTTDSRNLTKAIKEGEADIVINWQAPGYWPENRDYVDILPLPEEIAPKKELILNVLTFSTEPELAKDFLEYTGIIGRDVFESFGF
ncbi:MAG: substrate-binding domain-containing protein, partial [Candidatus Omnitrophica bacterium]|nr:substrate-binding domain-containing protein [Candidatus Omnitrophota bacterium]